MGALRRACAPLAAVVATAMALAACGGFESPDLSTGAVEGRLANARAGAYVYALGLPGAKAWPAADGRFSLAGLPAGNVTLAVIDGPDPSDGTRRAALVPAVVEGADETELPDVDAEALPLAGRVWALARPEKGVVARAPRFTVVGTDQIDVLPGPTGLALLDPLPPGSYELSVSMDGFSEARVAIGVGSSSSIEEVPLAIDPSTPAPGCASTGACVNGLVCDASDGECEECVSDGECEARHGVGATCDGGSCAAGSSAAGEVCAACTAGEQCASGVCESGICTWTCTTSLACPAGFECPLPASGPRVCLPRGGCADYRETFGEECLDDARCQSGLANGRCEGEDPLATPPVPGHCTATCDRALPGVCDVVPGWACTGGGMANWFCEPAP